MQYLRCINVPLKLSIIKPIHAQWMIGLYDYLRNNKEMIIKSFKMAGIKEAMEIDLPSENPFEDLL